MNQYYGFLRHKQKSLFRWIGIFIVFCSISAFVAAVSSAATLTVNSIADNMTAGDGFVTLREAVNASNTRTTTDLGETGTGNDIIVFDKNVFFNPQSVTLTMGEIRIWANISIIGKGIDHISLNGNGGEIFHVRDNASVTIENLTIKNGIARGGNGETKATGGGGGAGMGGALYVGYGNVTCYKVKFDSNKAIGGDGGKTGSGSEGGKGGASSHGYSEGGAGGTNNTGYWGGYGAGGGGGVAEWIGNHAADKGGGGGFGGGGGGGGGGAFTYATGGPGGLFGGSGGNGNLGWSNGGGGGGAGLGGAIYVSEHGSLVLDNCVLKNNRANGGAPGAWGQSGKGKGGAVFGEDYSRVSFFKNTFENNTASDALGTGFSTTGGFSDTTDVYGNVTVLSPPISPASIAVTTLDDKYTSSQVIPAQSVSLREAVQKVQDGGTITFSESILPGKITVNPLFGAIMIEKNLKIAGPGVDKLTISGGNRSRVFFVGKVKVEMSRFRIADGLGKGGSGGLNAGGAAGMGGGLFSNRSTLTLDQIDFINCKAQGGDSGRSDACYSAGGGGGFGGDARGGAGGDGGELSLSGGSDSSGDGKGGNGAQESTRGGWGGFAGGGGGGCWVSYNDDVTQPGQGGFGGGYGGISYGSDVRGGAGYGGALFVRDGSAVSLMNCRFADNIAIGGMSSQYSQPYRANQNGAAIFVMDNVPVYGFHLTFLNNQCSESALPSGFQYNIPNNTHDVYGKIMSSAPSVVSVSRETPVIIDKINQKEVTYLASFNINVTGVDVSDFSFIKSDTLTDVRIASIDQLSPSLYRIHINYGAGYGKFSLRLVDNDTIISIFSDLPLFQSDDNPDGSFTGETYEILPLVIPLHAVLPLQGISAVYGQQAKEGFDLAASDINRKGGPFGSKMEIRYHDTGSTDKGSQQAVSEALADSQAFGVLTALSSNTISIATPAVEQKITLFSPATTIQLRGYPKYMAKTCPLDDYQVNAMIHYLKNEKIDKIIVLADNSSYGASLLKLLQQTTAVEVKKFYLYTTGELQNQSSVLQEAVNTLASVESGVATGILAGYAGDANAFFKAVQDHPNLRYLRWLVSDGCVFDETIKDIPSIFLANNLVGFTPATAGYLTPDHSEDFQYEKMYNKKPTWDVYYNYDTALTFFKAFEKNRNGDPQTLWSAIPGLKFTGVTGLKEFDKEGELVSAVYNVYKVLNGQWSVVGQDRVDQPPPGVIPRSSGVIGGVTELEPDPRSLGFKQWLPGDDPGIGHFSGTPGEKESWVAESGDLDEGYTLMAYYEDTRRGQNNYGKSFIFADGMPYHLSFDMNRKNLAGSPGTGSILEIELTSVVCFLDEDGNESFNSSSLLKQAITFNDWPNANLKRINVPFVYHAPDMPDRALPFGDGTMLKWELRLFNSAKQEVQLRKVWTWAEPLDGELAPVDSAVLDWSLQ